MELQKYQWKKKSKNCKKALKHHQFHILYMYFTFGYIFYFWIWSHSLIIIFLNNNMNNDILDYYLNFNLSINIQIKEWIYYLNYSIYESCTEIIIIQIFSLNSIFAIIFKNYDFISIQDIKIIIHHYKIIDYSTSKLK